jgi:drug/metabolite transporter (DMT)-like permease
MGIGAIVVWSSTIAVSRSLAEQIGALTASSWALLLAGVLGCAYALVQRRFSAMLRLPLAYLLGCGSIFVAYMVCLSLAIGLAPSRAQAMEVGLVNYLWPALTLALSVPILHLRVRLGFPIGILVALGGGVLSALQPGQSSLVSLVAHLRASPWPYLLALIAAVLWALYSTLSRRWAARSQGGAVPLFALASGIVLGALRPAFAEPAYWSVRVAAELIFMALLPTLIAYGMWDRAVRRGNVTLIAALSYLIPVVSTAISSLYLGVSAGWNLWAACALIVSGAVICERSVLGRTADSTAIAGAER